MPLPRLNSRPFPGLGPQPANLGKLALAGLYRQTSRDAQAIDLYNAVVAKPSETVPAVVAQLDLADLYVAENKQDQHGPFGPRSETRIRKAPPAPLPPKNWPQSSKRGQV